MSEARRQGDDISGSHACPRCGQPVAYTGRGRPPIWCSHACRRAAYEARRAAHEGEKSITVTHLNQAPPIPLDDHVAAVLASPAAIRAVLRGLVQPTRDGAMRRPEWSGVWLAVEALLDAQYHVRW